MAGSRRVKQKLVGLLQPGSHVGGTWTSLLIQSHSFLFFSKTVTPHLLLLSSSLLLFANLSEITSGVSVSALCLRVTTARARLEQKSPSPHVNLPRLFYSLTVCSSFLSLSATLSQWFFLFSLLKMRRIDTGRRRTTGMDGLIDKSRKGRLNYCVDIHIQTF